VDRHGTPLAIRLTAANVNDGVMFATLLDAIPGIRMPSGQRRKRPDKVHADKAYASAANRAALRRRHIRCRIARLGIEPKDRLGRHRWVVERTLAWLGQFRRLRIRDERRADIHQAFLTLACALICFRKLRVGGFC
jgi:transposase